MSDTVKSTIISRVDDLGEAAITSWGEQASIRPSAWTTPTTFAFSIIVRRPASDRLVTSTMSRTKFSRSLRAQSQCGLPTGVVAVDVIDNAGSEQQHADHPAYA